MKSLGSLIGWYVVASIVSLFGEWLVSSIRGIAPNYHNVQFFVAMFMIGALWNRVARVESDGS